MKASEALRKYGQHLYHDCSYLWSNEHNRFEHRGPVTECHCRLAQIIRELEEVENLVENVHTGTPCSAAVFQQAISGTLTEEHKCYLRYLASQPRSSGGAEPVDQPDGFGTNPERN